MPGLEDATIQAAAVTRATSSDANVPPQGPGGAAVSASGTLAGAASPSVAPSRQAPGLVLALRDQEPNTFVDGQMIPALVGTQDAAMALKTSAAVSLCSKVRDGARWPRARAH